MGSARRAWTDLRGILGTAKIGLKYYSLDKVKKWKELYGLDVGVGVISSNEKANNHMGSRTDLELDQVV